MEECMLRTAFALELDELMMSVVTALGLRGLDDDDDDDDDNMNKNKSLQHMNETLQPGVKIYCSL